MTGLQIEPGNSIPGCKCCFKKIDPQDQFCQACGFPLQGTSDEQSAFFYNRNYHHMEVNGLKQKVRSASTTLYVLAGVFFLFGVVSFFINPSSDKASGTLITNGILAVLFLLLGYWSAKKAVGCIISGMGLYGIVIITNFFADPSSIFQGIILKIIVISYLVKGLIAAMEAEKMKKQYNL